jgi:hypothetical protein
MERQAEAVAYLAMTELEQLDARTGEGSRGYVQPWLRDEQPRDRAIHPLVHATDAIVQAGRAG